MPFASILGGATRVVVSRLRVNEKHPLIMVNCFSSKERFLLNEKNCTVMCLMLLCYFTFLCLTEAILVHYTLR